MVRVEELSNLPAAQVRRTESAIAEQRQGAIDHERAVWELRFAHDRARRWWQWATWLRHRREERAFRNRAPRVDRTLADRLARQRAGVGAEERVTEDLRVLSDEWTVFRGYANRRGEVDHVLVGPRGVWAIEVKGRGVRVNVTGDEWWFDKFDRYGNLVERGVLADRSGRSWVGRSARSRVIWSGSCARVGRTSRCVQRWSSCMSVQNSGFAGRFASTC